MPDDRHAWSPPPIDLHKQPLRFLNAFWDVWRALADRAEGALARAHRLDLRSFIALSYIQSDAVSPGELARTMGVPKYEVTRTLDRLSDLGAITRTPSPHDARQQTLRATAQGQALWTAALGTLQQVVGGPLGALGAELDPLSAGLERLARLSQENA